MTRFAICTSVYESGRPYLAAWIDGVIKAAAGYSVTAIIAVDDFDAPEASFVPLREVGEVTFAYTGGASSPADVRATMFTAAVQSEAEIIVFCDMDDWLFESALSDHEKALSDSDFSYGDLQIVDRDGTDTGRRFYNGCNVPLRTDDIGQVADRNWMGLSNTAVRRHCIPADALRVPKEIVAVDWWFYSCLLKVGCRGTLSENPVAAYRMHEANILGAQHVQSIASLRRRIEIVEKHYVYFPDDPTIAVKAQALKRLREIFERNPDVILERIEKLSLQSLLWHEDIGRLLEL